jgi:uncharacterized protein (DUF427 family)
MKATWRGKTIASSDRTLDVGGYRYFPRETVDMTRLTEAPKNESDLECPHGVQFYDVIGDDGARSPRAAWSYLAPTSPAIRQVDHWIGFWNDVAIGD